MTKQIAQMERAGIVAELSDGLTDTEAEKFATLASEIACEDVDSYTKKLQTIRESYFKETKPVAKDSVESGTAKEQVIAESVAQYAQAIAKLNKK
jgi:hypothetical protein